ncbi:MAG: baseplate J/gp47 family protein [Acidiferrobacterales bacterium]
MPADITKLQPVKYLSGDFQSFKRDLIKFSQAHQSGVFGDYNETSPGMAILEFQAFVGDVLSFYLNQQFNELKQDQAQQIQNVVSFAKALGYRPQGKTAAQVMGSWYVQVPATTINGQVVPNDLYSPILRKGSQAQGPNGVTFETLDDIPFSASNSDYPRFVTGSKFDPNTGQPTFFALRKDIQMTAGKTVSDTFVLTQFQPFLSLPLSQQDVIEIISIYDSEGNEWVEVNYLPQDTVFDIIPNGNSDSDVVPYAMKLLPVPYRFISDRDPVSSITSIIFGPGNGVTFDDQLVPNLADLSLPLAGRRTYTTYAIDPQNFLKVGTLGLSPYDTTLTVTYRVGGGRNTNVAPGSINAVNDAILDFTSTGLDPGLMAGVVKSIETFNIGRSSGGDDAENIGQIKANSGAYFAAQNRVVTREDYIARILSLPAKFGKPDKVAVGQGTNTRAMNVNILSLDQNGFLTQATPTLLSNIQTYLSQFRMLTEGVNLLQTDILNLGLNFGVVVNPRYNKNEVLAQALGVLAGTQSTTGSLETDNMQIGQPLSITDLQRQVQAVPGVISVYQFDFVNKFGTSPQGLVYSNTRFDVAQNTANKILVCPDNGCFEFKYPTTDIVGAAK